MGLIENFFCFRALQKNLMIAFKIIHDLSLKAFLSMCLMIAFGQWALAASRCEQAFLDAEKLSKAISQAKSMRSDHVSSRVFDAEGDLAKHINQILLEYQLHGHVHVVNTGLKTVSALVDLMPKLGFTEERAFTPGGRASSNTQTKWVVAGQLRRLDYYPENLYLLPNREVEYRQASPQDVLFYVETAPTPGSGGRIFLHSTKDIENQILAQEGGKELRDLVYHHGLKIITGFVDARHPNRDKNYFHSWQELSGKTDIHEAVRELRKRKDEYDRVWIQKDSNGKTHTLMTSITKPGFKIESGETYLNVPRIALTSPSFENGYRKFTLGNDVELTDLQNNILRNAYLNTRNGGDLSKGDLLLLDNTRSVHSRESFDHSPENPNPRNVLVGMSGVRLSDNLSKAKRDGITAASNFTDAHFKPLLASGQYSNNREHLPWGREPRKPSDPRYVTPPPEVQMAERFSMQIFDLAGRDLKDPAVLAEIKAEYEKHGRLHVINNKRYADSLPEEVLGALGFGLEEQFQWGGKHSGRTVRQPLGKGFHAADKYPAHLTLLPHGEIFYQRVLPKHLLFHYRQVSGKNNGGRTLVHSGKQVEKLLMQSMVGRELVEKYRRHGHLIRTGFLDEHHPAKDHNFVRSWQDRFGTNNINEAIKIAEAQNSHFDRAWAEKLPEKDSAGNDTYMLMTEVTIPMFKLDTDGQSYMMFPRIDYDGPSIINGFRQFLIGNGKELTVAEKDVLLQAFWRTREGIYQSPGDLLLINNLRFGHSREPYLEVDATGTPLPRKAAVLMAGEFYTDDAHGRRIGTERRPRP